MLKEWQRIVFEGTPIYVNPEMPDWFVPNEKADSLLKEAAGSGGSADNPFLQAMMSRVSSNGRLKYSGRAEALKLDGLRELWIHLTNRCNLGCSHCMFASSPSSSDELSGAELHGLIDEATELGCRIFYFTGGEPLVHPALLPSLERVFRLPDAHAVILTNLTLVSVLAEAISAFPGERLHFQVSVDGLEIRHDSMRGAGAFNRLRDDLGMLTRLGFPATLAMTVTKDNVADMEAFIDFADENRISNTHFLWLFRKGSAQGSPAAPAEDVFLNLVKAQKRAEQRGVKIDNIENFRSQILSLPGTKYDLCNAGWQSLADGPDRFIYPTPALVYTGDMRCGALAEGLRKVWLESPVLKMIRDSSLRDMPAHREYPMRFLGGGPDIDHSYINCGGVAGCDPYLGLYDNILKWLIAEESKKYRTCGQPAIILKMGEKLGVCPTEGSDIFFTHSNCVLSLPGRDTHSLVNAFYTEAAESHKEDILNPVCYPEELISHIPQGSRFRGYGCGSPVEDAKLKAGERVVDLGSGTGIECFIAGRIVGKDGLVTGIDMGDAMLKIASRTKEEVERNLGYSNIEFRKAFLESIPLGNDSADVVISNCVINLSPDKRRVFSEIMRVLRPGGRLVISDITYDDDIPLRIRYDEKLRGECLGGALRYSDLFGLLDDLGFAGSRVLKGFLYRKVQGYDFYSITYEAFKPGGESEQITHDRAPLKTVVKSVSAKSVCACFLKPKKTDAGSPLKLRPAHMSGCMVCGEPLDYTQKGSLLGCFYCGSQKTANAVCRSGHFVCDACHRADATRLIRQVCFNTEETDMIAIMKKIRSFPAFPMHGPEHHSLVPAAILTACRNSGGTLNAEQILAGIDRASAVPGGACAFMGMCGSAVGVGIAFSIIMEADPCKAAARQSVQRVTSIVLGEIAGFEAARCCQRDGWVALTKAAALSEEYLGIRLKADEQLVCRQFSRNRECIKSRCPLWPRRNNTTETIRQQ